MYEAQEQEKSELKNNFTDILNWGGGKTEFNSEYIIFYLQEHTGLCLLPSEEFSALLTMVLELILVKYQLKAKKEMKPLNVWKVWFKAQHVLYKCSSLGKISLEHFK